MTIRYRHLRSRCYYCRRRLSDWAPESLIRELGGVGVLYRDVSVECTACANKRTGASDPEDCDYYPRDAAVSEGDCAAAVEPA